MSALPEDVAYTTSTTHTRQFKLDKKEVLTLKTYLGRVYRDILRNILPDPDLHAPEVECIAKGQDPQEV